MADPDGHPTTSPDAAAATAAALDAAATAAGAAARAALLPADSTSASSSALADAVAAATADAVRVVFSSLTAPASSTSSPTAHVLRMPGAQINSPDVVPIDLGDDATVALHAQAVAVLNIKTLIPVTLDLDTSNYTKWRGLFLVILGKYALAEHVLLDATNPDRPDWVRMDCVVLAWLYGSISAELLEIVMSSSSTARIVWCGLEHQFLGNREQRALNLSVEFHCFLQGDLSVTDYCRRLKSMVDGLADLSEPITDRTLVLTLLKGLNEKFRHLQTILPMQKPFPTFVEARSQLLLEEITRGVRPNSGGSPSVFLAAGSNGASRGVAPAPTPAHAAGYGPGGTGGPAGSGGNGGNNTGSRTSGGSKNNRRRRGNGGG
ncbi:uncharacterized protein LOC133920806 [Phragmites australis]|uniref:uncharacterized protein LOC133920806 n=1 Tax=Phragmites australis TaxID=29695 RepID=UPI002D77AB9F|nr:uncharacterized protein LOC133920806 [Phragmites australis]